MSRGTNRSNHGKRRLRALSTLGAMGIVAGLASALPASPAGASPVPVPAAAVAHQPTSGGKGVACNGQVYVSFGDQEGADQLYTADRGPGTVQFTPLGTPPPFLYNAIGVNPQDRFLYGTTFGTPTNDLVRFDGKGGFTDLGAIEGLPSALYISGTFDDEGNYYVLADDSAEIFRIDVTTHTVSGVFPVQGLEDPALNIFDIAFRNGFLWGATEDGAIARIDFANGSLDVFPGVLPGGSDFGGAFVYGNGDLGFFRNAGGLFRVRVHNATGSTPEFTLLSTQDTPTPPDTELVNLDATSCFLDSSADLSVRKEGPERVTAGDTVTYHITVRNEGPDGEKDKGKDEKGKDEKGKDKGKDKKDKGKGEEAGDSSGWSLTDDLPAKILSPTTQTEGCEITDGHLSCTGGPLAVGEEAEIEVTGTAAEVSQPTKVRNTATVFGDDADPNKDNDKSTAHTEIVPRVKR
ncbi:DUF11 domain-containing protein [Streptomyces sp. NPDC032472]|uniref:DUF11 domain-containing protein n=1 Tax=Streptomyces sp. NPDC032472 TaxID=3155018 RepID=UPI003409352F